MHGPASPQPPHGARTKAPPRRPPSAAREGRRDGPGGARPRDHPARTTRDAVVGARYTRRGIIRVAIRVRPLAWSAPACPAHAPHPRYPAHAPPRRASLLPRLLSARRRWWSPARATAPAPRARKLRRRSHVLSAGRAHCRRDARHRVTSGLRPHRPRRAPTLM